MKRKFTCKGCNSIGALNVYRREEFKVKPISTAKYFSACDRCGFCGSGNTIKKAQQ